MVRRTGGKSTRHFFGDSSSDSDTGSNSDDSNSSAGSETTFSKATVHVPFFSPRDEEYAKEAREYVGTLPQDQREKLQDKVADLEAKLQVAKRLSEALKGKQQPAQDAANEVQEAYKKESEAVLAPATPLLAPLLPPGQTRLMGYTTRTADHLLLSLPRA